MIKDNQDKPSGPIEIDLTGPEGNVFYLMGLALKFAKQLDLDGDAIVAQMKLKDYDYAVNVFDRYFGKYVILYK